MSRSAAAPADHDRAMRAPRGRAPALPRRVSGPVRPPRTRADAAGVAAPQAALAPGRVEPRVRPRVPSRPPLRLAAGSASIALRVADAALEVSGSRTMDRLVRSRGWVVIIAFALIGIVAMQVSMLKLNAGIGRAVETAATLERGNAALRGQISRLSSGDRIQTLAGARGFVMPEPADVTYLRAGSVRADGSRAARRMTAPDRALAGPAGAGVAVPPASLSTGVPAAAATAAESAAPAGNAPAAPAATAQATADGAGAPAEHTHPPAATSATAPSSTAAVPAAAGTPQATSSGGVTVP